MVNVTVINFAYKIMSQKKACKWVNSNKHIVMIGATFRAIALLNFVYMLHTKYGGIVLTLLLGTFTKSKQLLFNDLQYGYTTLNTIFDLVSNVNYKKN